MADILNSCQQFEINGQSLYLHHERAVFWPARKTLLVADIHMGKEHVFGRAGIAVPGGSSQQNLNRLNKLIKLTTTERLIILGDFMHALPLENEPWLDALGTFLDSHTSLRVDVVVGNHDHNAGQSLLDSRITWHQESLQASPFVLQHEPGVDPRGYVLCGHLHPVHRVTSNNRTRGSQSLRAPAFWFREHYGVLPAFGKFTGGHRIVATADDNIYLSGPDCVLPVQCSAPTRREPHCT